MGRRAHREKGEVFVNQNRAWENFYQTGKVADYIKYSQMKNKAAGGPGTGNKTQTETPAEVQSAVQNPGAYNQGTDNRGERPAGNSFN